MPLTNQSVTILKSNSSTFDTGAGGGVVVPPPPSRSAEPLLPLPQPASNNDESTSGAENLIRSR